MLENNLLQLYASSFRKNWELACVTEYGSGSTMTYGDLARRIAATHLLFKELGIKQGDKIALMGGNTISWVTAYMATITYGAVIVPVLQDFRPDDARHILDHSDSVLLFVQDSIFENLEFDKLPNIKAALSLNGQKVLAENPTTGKSATKAISKIPGLMRKRYPRGFRAEDVAYPLVPKSSIAEINYTSGTTGFSKGVMLTHNNLCGNVDFALGYKLHWRGSRLLSFLPLAHAYGCAFDMLTPLAAGTHVTLLGKLPTPRILLKALSEVRPHLVLSVPLILEKIYRNKLKPVLEKPAIKQMLKVPGVRQLLYKKICGQLKKAFGGEAKQIVIGGAALNHEVEEFLHDIKFPFTVGYGMTECGPLISYTPPKEYVLGSSGRTLPGYMHSKIAGSPDPERVPGEILVRGENVMLGYYKNPDATEAALDEDGWLHTGDMGTRTQDGTLFIRGRYKTMILSPSGQNIYPEEIEAKLNNLPYVAESLVVERGKHLVALVYPDYEATDRDGITHEKMADEMDKVLVRLNQLVAPYERIDKIQLIPNEFEKTPKKSIKRFLYA